MLLVKFGGEGYSSGRFFQLSYPLAFLYRSGTKDSPPTSAHFKRKDSARLIVWNSGKGGVVFCIERDGYLSEMTIVSDGGRVDIRTTDTASSEFAVKLSLVGGFAMIMRMYGGEHASLEAVCRSIG